MSDKVFTFALLGAGGRGSFFAKWILDNPHQAKLVAVAEPDPARRKAIADAHKIPESMQFAGWEQLLARPRLADALVNTTMDRLHAPSAVPALNLGYHMLLEKPMATTLEDCIAIDRARERNGRIVSICHSLRYFVSYVQIKKLLDAGAIGRLLSVDQLEGVNPIHQSHSFVRGNWGNESRSTFMLMSKSCHDIDILAYLINEPCRRVCSYGQLSHFRLDQAPPGAPERCTDGCPHEQTCDYSALKVYLHERAGWYGAHAGFGGKTIEEKMQLLRTGPFGRCVYRTDNDVVDHQVVAMEFKSGITATFTMTAFDAGGRRVRLHGTEGTIYSAVDSNKIEVRRFRDMATQVIEIPWQGGGHGGGDNSVISSFVHAMRTENPAAVLTTTSESLASHKIVFAAERSRREGRSVDLAELG